MVTSPNGAAALPTDLLATDDDSVIEAVAPPPEPPEPSEEPDVEGDEADAPDPDDIDIVDDDEAGAEQEPTVTEEPPAEAEVEDPAWKREYRQSLEKRITAKVLKTLRGEEDPRNLNSYEARIYRELARWKDEVETPVRRTREEQVWGDYGTMWSAYLTNPQQFNEFWRDPRKRAIWTQMEAHRDTLGLDPGIDPRTFRERFDEYNAQFKDEASPPGTAAEEYYEEIQDSPLWRDLSDEEKGQLAPTKFKGSETQVIAAMAYQRGLLASAVKARKARRPVEERVAEVNKTATNAQKAAKGAPLGVVRGVRTTMTVQQIRELAAKGDPQGLKLYAKWKERRKATA